jgi:outer membrane protein OmpA-like peptidoglycan-associated protein
MIKNIVAIFFLLMMTLRVNAQNFEVVHLYFNADSFKLNHAQKHVLDSIVENCSNRRIMIYGHADYLGSEDKLKLIAGMRANASLRYLVDRGFPETQIVSTTAAGQPEVNTGNRHSEDAINRRVDIFITKGPLVRIKLKSPPEPDPPPVYIKPETPKAVVKPTSRPKEEEPPKVTDLDYKKMKVGDIIALKNITFVPGSDTILPESFPELDNLYNMLQANPTLKIKLEGHVCCSIYPDGYFQGTPNWELSVDRALMVQNLLIEKGIAADRISYAGFGHTRPIYAEEQSYEEAQSNRRVEIRIIEK